MRTLIFPVNIMELEHAKRFYIDCPIDVFPGTEIRRIEIPRELARYIKQLQDEIERLKTEQPQ